MIFSNIDFTVRYLDPSAASGGDGSTPAKAMKSFPEDIYELEDNIAWIIRRTSEDHAMQLPRGECDSVQNILFFGMPKSTDAMWSIVPDEAKTAWGADTAEYANIKADTGDDPWGDECSFRLNNGKTFLLHRCYVFRDNTPAYSSIFKFPSSDYIANISIEHCKFGSKGIDLEKSNFTAAVSNSNCSLYFHVNTAYVFSMHHCIVNVVNYGDDYYYDSNNPINVYNARYFSVSDIDVFTTTSQYGGDYGPGSGTALNFSNGSWGGAYSDYEDLRFHILINKNWGYFPALFYSAVNDYCVLKNVTVEVLERRLGSGEPSAYGVSQTLIRSHGSREFEIENITVNLPKCWKVWEYSKVVSLSGFCNSNIPGYSKSIKNITINLAETDGVDDEYEGNYYEWVQYGRDDPGQYHYFSALEMSFSERNYYEGSWEPVIAKGIVVNHPRGVALYAYGCQIRNCNLKGAVKLRRCVADIDSVETYYPGYALFAAEATTLRVGNLTLGKANASVTGGADDPAVGSRYRDNSFIYVENSNGALKSNIGDGSTDVSNCYNFICGNEVDTGHYTCRSNNYICDTWNAHRVGGSPAVWKFTSSADGSGGMSLGRAPFKGMQITPSATGVHTLTMHIATKGLTSITDLNRQLLIQISVPQTDGTQKVLFSSTHGQWLADSDAEWVNDSELNQQKIVMPLEVMTTDKALDVKIHYQLYSTSGYVYIDPVLDLTPKQ